MSDGRLARRPLRLTPGIRRLHRRSTHSPPSLHSRQGYSQADRRRREMKNGN